MTCLSILPDDSPATVAANPIFPLEPFAIRTSAEIKFEVFEADAAELKTLVGEYRCFYIDGAGGTFWAQLKTLERCVSTHPGLAMLRDKPTLRGVLLPVREPTTKPAGS
jgi:hypothetical protein